MYSILDDETYTVEDRLAMAKEILLMKDKEIVKLDSELSKVNSDHIWSTNNQMGS